MVRPEAELKALAGDCLRQALKAVDPAPLVKDALVGRAELLASAERLVVVAFGKAAAAMVEAALQAVRRPAEVVVVLPEGSDPVSGDGVQCFFGGHPLPTEEGIAGAEKVAGLVSGLAADDLLLVLISGGGSALLSLPPDELSLADLRVTVDLLLKSGVDISRLNLVRRHLDRLKAGRLARLAAPARVLGLVLSDVPGDRLEVVASGPLSADDSRPSEALAVLDEALGDGTPEAVRHFLEGPASRAENMPPGSGDPSLERVELELLAGNRQALDALAEAVADQGYTVTRVPDPVIGEARSAGRRLASTGLELASGFAGSPQAVVAGGETTVTVTGAGRGGRNQELVVAAAEVLAGHEGIALASLASDGVDGESDAAGGAVDGSTVQRACELGRSINDVLTDNDSASLLEALGDNIVTGPTGTNVADLHVVLVRPCQSE